MANSGISPSSCGSGDGDGDGDGDDVGIGSRALADDVVACIAANTIPTINRVVFVFMVAA